MPCTGGPTRPLGVTLEVLVEGWSRGGSDQTASVEGEQLRSCLGRVEKSHLNNIRS